MEEHKLTEGELWAITRLIRGEEADFSRFPSQEFRAETLRRLMLNLPVGAFGSSIRLTGMGIRLKHAVITEGMLDLEHGSLNDGSDMPRLSLVSCEIKDGINLKSARLRRLCLKSTKISELLADHVHISGLLDIRFLSGHPNSGKLGTGKKPQPLCRLSLCGAHLEDGIEAGGAHLVASPPDPDYAKYSERSIYALDIPEAHIKGDVRLFPDFVACGGINLNGAVIYGSIQAHGAQLTDAQMYGLDACGATIHGDLALDTRVISAREHQYARSQGRPRPGVSRFNCEGQLRLHNTVINENLRLFGAIIHGPNGGIAAEQMTVHGDAYLCAFDNGLGERTSEDGEVEIFNTKVIGFDCQKRIGLRGATIRGDLSFKGATLRGDLDISASQIGGNLHFDPQPHLEKSHEDPRRDNSRVERFCAKGEIKLNGTAVKGNVYFEGAVIKGRLKAFGLMVGGYADFSPHVPKSKSVRTWPFEAHDRINLDGSNITQKLDLSGALLMEEFTAPNITVGGKLLMCAYAHPDRPEDLFLFEAKKHIDLSGAVINSDFDLTGAILHMGIGFRCGVVNRALIFDLYDPDGVTNTKPDDRCGVDLYNAHANILADLHFSVKPSPSKRRKPKVDVRLAYQQSYYLRLEGFSYGRFAHYIDEGSLGDYDKSRRLDLRKRLANQFSEIWDEKIIYAHKTDPEKILKLRIEWINFQYRGDSKKPNDRAPNKFNYNSDPFNKLYKFYKRMGNQKLADDALIHKLRVERHIALFIGKLKSNPWYVFLIPFDIIYFLFDHLFGYGLKPIRTTVLFLSYVALVTLLIWRSDNTIKLSGWKPLAPLMIGQTEVPTSMISIPNITVINTPDTGRFETKDIIIKYGTIKSEDIENKENKDEKNCESDIKLYSSFTYAIENIIPYFDINERDTCDYTPKSNTFWGWFKIISSILGWLITSITLLTWTGIFRRNVEP